jgi:hypothetical protein
MAAGEIGPPGSRGASSHRRQAATRLATRATRRGWWASRATRGWWGAARPECSVCEDNQVPCTCNTRMWAQVLGQEWEGCHRCHVPLRMAPRRQREAGNWQTFVQTRSTPHPPAAFPVARPRGRWWRLRSRVLLLEAPAWVTGALHWQQRPWWRACLRAVRNHWRPPDAAREPPVRFCEGSPVSHPPVPLPRAPPILHCALCSHRGRPSSPADTYPAVGHPALGLFPGV